MAKKKKTKKGFGSLIDKIQTQQDQIEKLTSSSTPVGKSAVLEDRIKKLETEVKESYALVGSQIAINKALISRLQPVEQADKIDTDALAPPSKEDSSATILGKMFAFWKHNAEEDDKDKEKQRRSAKETASENKRKKSVTPKKTATKADIKKPTSNPILTLLESLVGGVASLVGFLSGGLVGLITGGIETLFGGLSAILRALPGGGLLAGAVGAVGSAASGAIGGIASIVTSIIAASGGLIWGLLKPVILGAMASVIGGLGSVLSAVAGFIFKTIAVNGAKSLLASLSPAGLIAAVGLSAYEAYANIKGFGENAIYGGSDIEEQQNKVNKLGAQIDNPVTEFTNANPGQALPPELSTEENVKKYKQQKFNQWLEESKALKSMLEDRYEKLSKILKSKGYKPYTEEQQLPASYLDQFKGFFEGFGPTSSAKLKTIKILGFEKEGEKFEFARTGDGPNLNKNGVDQPFLTTLVAGANASIEENLIAPVDTYFSDKANQALKGLESNPNVSREDFNTIKSAVQPTTNPAPSEKPENDNTAVTPQVTQPLPAPVTPSVTPQAFKPMDDFGIDSGPQVVNLPETTNAITQGKKEKRASPQTRNPALDQFTKGNFGMAP